MPMAGLQGGILIGLAADTLLLYDGDIMGASGIVTSTILSNPIKTITDPSNHWKIVFLTSFVSTAILLIPKYDATALTLSTVNARSVSNAGYCIAGLLVGFGTRLGNGCTSGHGICGLGRASPRSLAAVLTFLTTGIVASIATSPKNSMFAVLYNGDGSENNDRNSAYGTAIALTGLAASIIAFFLQKKKKEKTDDVDDDDDASRRKLIPACVSGALFSLGLYVSGMAYQSKVFGFLDVSDISKTWDATLMMVMGGGVVVSFAAYQLLEQFRLIKLGNNRTCKHPLALSDKSSFKNIPTSTAVDWKLLLGSLSFGLGWGVGGLCPGPAIFQAAIGSVPVVQYWWPSYFVGAHIANEVKKKM